MRLLMLGALIALPPSAQAAVIRVTTPHAPPTRPSSIALLRVARATDGVVVAAGALRFTRSVSVPDGVYVVLGNVAVLRRAPLQASAGAVAGRRAARLSLRLHRYQAGIAAAAARSAAADAPVLTAQNVVLDRTPRAGQPNIPLDGVLNGYLFSAFHGDGVRIVDQTPEFTVAALREQLLSTEGRLATRFTFNPLKPTHVVRGQGRIRNGKVDIELRIVDDSGAIVAIASAHGKARDLRDVVVKAVGELAAQARGKLHTGETQPSTCTAAGSPSCFGVRVTVEGLFDQTGGWGSGSVAAPADHPGLINEGFDSVEHGSFGYWPSGTSFTLTATPHRGSHFDHWSGSCAGTAPTCTLRAQPNLDATAFFAEDLWTLTIVNKNPSGGEAAGTGIGCGIREHTCSRILAGQTSDGDFFDLSIYPEASHLVSQLEGCDEFVGSPEEGGDCKIAATSNKTITVDFACNPNATTPCGGIGAAADRVSRSTRRPP